VKRSDPNPVPTRPGTTGLRRGVRLTIWACILGMATTLGLAAGLFLAERPAVHTEVMFRDRHRFAGEGLGRIIVRVNTRPGAAHYDAAVYPTCVSTVGGEPRNPEEALPSWAVGAVLPWVEGRRPWPQDQSGGGSAPAPDTVRIEATGWPLLAVWRPLPSIPAAPRGAPASRTEALDQLAASMPQWRPIWRGLMLNSGVFGSLWLVGLSIPVLALGAVRALRRHCPGCGYDLEGLMAFDRNRVRCPECGRLCRARHPRRALTPAT
jgi:hypothetical protein